MTKISKKTRGKGPLNPVQLTLALRLRSLREAREPAMTQVDLAKLVGRNKASVSHWESGENEPSTAILIQLATLYGVSVNYLLGLEDRPSKPQPHTALEGRCRGRRNSPPLSQSGARWVQLVADRR